MAVSVVRKFDVPARMRPLDSILAAPKSVARSARFTIQKKIERISPESALRTVAGRRIGRIAAK